MRVAAPSPPEWIECVLAQFDRFLLDHAAAERKAAAMAVSFVVQYPDRYALHGPLITLAREELLHYKQVMALIRKRKLVWERDEKDPYIQYLIKHLDTTRDGRLLDRLLMGGVVEARGVERFGLVATHHKDTKMQQFYGRLRQSEANHANLFPKLAGHFFGDQEIEDRLQYWLALEARAMASVTPRPALH